MADLRLTLAMADYDRTAALRDGSVTAAGIDLAYVVSPPSETFWRMLKLDEFDVSEMSLSSFLIARAQGRAWTAVPVFPFRAFFHTNIYVRADSATVRAEDLAGARVGLPEYQVTAALWMRGALQHDFGVPPSAIRWYVERRKARSHGGQTGFSAPPGVSVEEVPEGETLGSMLIGGALDAVMPSPFPGMKSMLNETDLLQLARSPHVRPLFPDPIAEGVRYLARNGFSHINHVVVIRDDVLERHPWAALSLFRAFEEAKQACYARIDRLVRSPLVFGLAHLETERRMFGEDPCPYGLRANRAALHTLAEYSFEQGLTARRAVIDDLFAESTRGL